MGLTRFELLKGLIYYDNILLPASGRYPLELRAGVFTRLYFTVALVRIISDRLVFSISGIWCYMCNSKPNFIPGSRKLGGSRPIKGSTFIMIVWFHRRLPTYVISDAGTYPSIHSLRWTRIRCPLFPYGSAEDSARRVTLGIFKE